MALDVLVASSRSLADADPSPKAQLGHDGYYWHLYPLLHQIPDEGGQTIDLYGDAFFEGESLAGLERALRSALDGLPSLPDRWSVHIETSPGPPPDKVYDEVARERYGLVIQRLLDVVVAARERGKGVWWLGD